MNPKVKTDLRYEFEEILIPGIQIMLEKEDQHCKYLRSLDANAFNVPIDRAIDLSMDCARLYRQRIQEYKKYVSELKD